MPQRTVDDFESAGVSCLEPVLLAEFWPACYKPIRSLSGARIQGHTFHLPRIVALHGLERDLATLHESEGPWQTLQAIAAQGKSYWLGKLDIIGWVICITVDE